MSGALTLLSTLFGGAPPVVLGPVVFTELEVPEKSDWGGAQHTVVHKLPGGQRVIDAMGRDDLDINWSGILEGPFATQRALEIDAIRVAGQQVMLSWDVLNWTVVVVGFTAHYSKRNWIPYSIKCLVVQDNSANFAAPPATLEVSVGLDLTSALNVGNASS